MPTHGSGNNEFLPFATGVGANVESPGDYSADPVRQQGFQVGVADPTKLNTVWRQASVIASMIGQFAADYTNTTISDDGDVIGLEDQYVNALKALLQPLGVYFMQDTGSANQVVGTSDPAPEGYQAPCFIVFRKVGSDNTGAMTCNFWGKGVVALRDNTGADLTAATILANSFYMCAWDGGGFRILGGAAQYTNVTNLTANSGDGVDVTVAGVVNRRRTRGTHDVVVNSLDKWSRGKAADDSDLYMTNAEFLAYLNANLSFIKTVPASGTGVQVGQEVVLAVAVNGLSTSLETAGIWIGSVHAASELNNGLLTGTTAYYYGGFGFVSNYGAAAYYFGSTLASKVLGGPLTGTWQLIAAHLTSGSIGILSSGANYALTFRRIA
jgi:hypothetical protein